MARPKKKQRIISYPRLAIFLALCSIIISFAAFQTFHFTKWAVSAFFASVDHGVLSTAFENPFVKPKWEEKPQLNKKEYDARLYYLAHRSTSTKELDPSIFATSTVGSSAAGAKGAGATSSSPIAKVTKYLWPVTTAAYPNAGAILPFKRVVAYYGNLYSKKMGVLGEYEPAQVLEKLQAQVKEWELADPQTPVQPALHYIAVVAQGSAGKDGKYRARMPDEQIEKVLEMAKQINAIVFLDVQVALSNVQTEIPLLEKYLKMPNVHLGIDPEFSMKFGDKPGSVIGTMDATDINFTAEYLAKVVRENNLPPKILTFYRFTRNMVTNYKNIVTRPEVQLVLAMDGWGHQARKIGTYNSFVAPEPIQFTGFKLFYKNDLKQEGSRLMTPAEVLKVTPSPIYIQYQ